MIEIHRATFDDLDFMLWVDKQGEGYDHDEDRSPEHQAKQRAKFESFLSTPSRAAWFALDGDAGVRAGLVMCIFRDLSEPGSETPGNTEFYRSLPDLCKVGRFCEVFQLWVTSRFSSSGIGHPPEEAVGDRVRQSRHRSHLHPHQGSKRPRCRAQSQDGLPRNPARPNLGRCREDQPH